MNCLMTRRGYKVTSPVWDFEGEIVLIKFPCKWIGSKDFTAKKANWFQEANLIKRNIGHIPSSLQRESSHISRCRETPNNGPCQTSTTRMTSKDGWREWHGWKGRWEVGDLKKGRRFRLVLVAQKRDKRERHRATKSTKHGTCTSAMHMATPWQYLGQAGTLKNGRFTWWQVAWYLSTRWPGICHQVPLPPLPPET